MDLEETVNANDMSSSTSEPSRSLTMHMPGTITQSPDTNCIEFTPLVDPSNLLPLHREDVKNHQPKPHRKKRLLIMCFMYLCMLCNNVTFVCV